MNKRLSMPDGLRVIAIGLVAWFHIWQQSWLMPVAQMGNITVDFTPVVRTGYIMVDIMLLLSGYLLFIPIARGGRLDVLPFYKKRLARILPSYLLSVLVMLFAFALPANDWQLTPRLTRDLITHLTFTHTFFHETYVGTALNVVLWTLAIEMQFYLEEVDEWVADKISEGNSLYDGTYEVDLGTVTKVEREQSIAWGLNQNGEYVQSSRDGFCSLTITGEVEGQKTAIGACATFKMGMP